MTRPTKHPIEVMRLSCCCAMGSEVDLLAAPPNDKGLRFTDVLSTVSRQSTFQSSPFNWGLLSPDLWRMRGKGLHRIKSYVRINVSLSWGQGLVVSKFTGFRLHSTNGDEATSTQASHEPGVHRHPGEISGGVDPSAQEVHDFRSVVGVT
jgi:hypothetical protein